MCINMLFTSLVYLSLWVLGFLFVVFVLSFGVFFLLFCCQSVMEKKIEADAVIGDCRPNLLHALLSNKNNEAGL